MSFSDPEALTSDGRTFTQWSPRDVAYLKVHHRNDPNTAIAERLGKTEKSVRSMANRLRLRKGKKRLTQMGRENVSKRRDR